SKTSENVAFGGGGGKSSKPSIRQLRNKNHLQLLKLVDSPRLPCKSAIESAKEQSQMGGVETVESFRLPPSNFANATEEATHGSSLQRMTKSGSFDFVSFSNNLTAAGPPSADHFPAPVTLDEIINSEDFPPPPPNLESPDGTEANDITTQ